MRTKEQRDSRPKGSNGLKPATRRLLSSGKDKGSLDVSIPPGALVGLLVRLLKHLLMLQINQEQRLVQLAIGKV